MFDFPVFSVDGANGKGAMRQLEDYLFRLIEELRFVLGSIDEENLSAALKARLQAMSAFLEAPADEEVLPVARGGTGAAAREGAFANLVAPGGRLSGNLVLENNVALWGRSAGDNASFNLAYVAPADTVWLGSSQANAWICSKDKEGEYGYVRLLIGGNVGSGKGAEMYQTTAGVLQFRPMSSNTVTLGSSSYKWKDIYGVNGSINTSDRNEKKEIAPLPGDRAKAFVMGLSPVSYKFIDNDSDRTHYGLVAQDVEELLARLDMTGQDFAGFIKSPKTAMGEDGETETPLPGEYSYGLRYTEFIAPLIKTVQLQQAALEELNARIAALEKQGGNMEKEG